ncbi:AMP-binding protein [Dictyobacter vulcani]|nr:AMP-binding protein [Dictyobacter vulcani]
MLTAQEYQQIVYEWNTTATEYPDQANIPGLFEEQVARTPEATAIIYADERISYAELNRRANQIAHYLQQQGVQPDTLVALCLERSVAMLVAILGILKAGAAYLPLDPTYPKERLALILENSQAQILLAQAALSESLPAFSGHCSTLKMRPRPLQSSRPRIRRVASAAITCSM